MAGAASGGAGRHRGGGLIDLTHLCYVFLACAIQGSNYLLSVETSCVRNAEIAEMRIRRGAGVNRADAGQHGALLPHSSGCAGAGGGGLRAPPEGYGNRASRL